ncbi:hypothetical protein GCM10018780_25550 [Streptomyces lanatus]|nr:hypothetical protein GCM10018780_25550 [Streptomyces lanatus]
MRRPHLLQRLRGRGVTERITRMGVGDSKRLGRHLWSIERAFARLDGCTGATDARPAHFSGLGVITIFSGAGVVCPGTL